MVLETLLSMDSPAKMVILPGVEDVEASLRRFQWPDYVMFIAMLLVCVVIGIYFGVRGASSNTQEYLMGGRKMRMLPITMSLIASWISGISILGIPTETYLYGVQYLYLLGGLVIMSIIMTNIYLPVFYGLNITSTYEYLERRFDKKVRFFGSLLFTVAMLTWLPIVIYVPALAFNQVTGVNVHAITPILCVICIFYTSLGGLKAVVWTDVIQAFIMFGSMILVVVKGTIDVGGLSTVYWRNQKSGRIETPNLEFNPVSRYTLWSLVIGGGGYYLQVAAVNQNMIQRYLSLPTLRKAKITVWLFSLGLFFVIIICGYTGLLIYATYYNCDPLTTKLAKEKDQLLPLLVMQVLGDYPGLSGVFVAGILSASLSSLSTGLNAMSAIVLEDFYQFFSSKPLTERQSALITRLTVVVFGGICVALAYIIQYLGTVLQLTMTLGSTASGSTLGIFTMGILIPWVNSKGALVGGIFSLVVMGWISFRAQADLLTGALVFPVKPLSTESCFYHFIPKHINTTQYINPEESFNITHISYLWYTLLGASISIIVGLIVSLLTKHSNPKDVDPRLLAPCLRRFIKPRDFPNEPFDGVILAYGSQEQEKIQLECIRE